MAAYKDYIYTCPPFDVEPLTMEQVKEECLGCSHSAPGPDGFEPAEMSMLAGDAYQHLAYLLNLIEDGCPWPDGHNEARAVFMEKEEGNVDDPSSSGCSSSCRPSTGGGPPSDSHAWKTGLEGGPVLTSMRVANLSARPLPRIAWASKLRCCGWRAQRA